MRRLGSLSHLESELFSSCCFGLGPPSNEAFVLTCTHDQTSVVEREGFDEAAFFGVNIATNDLDALL